MSGLPVKTPLALPPVRQVSTTTTKTSVRRKDVHKQVSLPPKSRLEQEPPDWILAAVEHMTLRGLPPRCKQLGIVGLRLLALCRSLQDLNDRAALPDFLLSSPIAAAAVGLDPDNPTDLKRCHRLLCSTFVWAGWLVVTRRGDRHKGGRSNAYRFLGFDDEGGGAA